MLLQLTRDVIVLLDQLVKQQVHTQQTHCAVQQAASSHQKAPGVNVGDQWNDGSEGGNGNGGHQGRVGEASLQPLSSSEGVVSISFSGSRQAEEEEGLGVKEEEREAEASRTNGNGNGRTSAPAELSASAAPAASSYTPAGSSGHTASSQGLATGSSGSSPVHTEHSHDGAQSSMHAAGPGSNGNGSAAGPVAVEDRGIANSNGSAGSTAAGGHSATTTTAAAAATASRLPPPVHGVTVVGESFGGALALRLALTAPPGLIQRVALINPATCFNQSLNGG